MRPGVSQPPLGLRDRGLLRPSSHLAHSSQGLLEAEHDHASLLHLGLAPHGLRHSPMAEPAPLSHGQGLGLPDALQDSSKQGGRHAS